MLLVIILFAIISAGLVMTVTSGNKVNETIVTDDIGVIRITNEDIEALTKRAEAIDEDEFADDEFSRLLRETKAGTARGTRRLAA